MSGHVSRNPSCQALAKICCSPLTPACCVQTLTQAHENITRVRQKADLTLQHMDTARQV